jgi:hypothetical protein
LCLCILKSSFVAFLSCYIVLEIGLHLFELLICLLFGGRVSFLDIKNVFNVQCHLSDVNECVGGNHGCQHQCNNTEGSFVCSCNAGYTLNATDSKTCLGQ